MIKSKTIRLRNSSEKDIDFILTLEQAEGNREFVGQWTREQHINAFTAPDILHLIVEDSQTRAPVGYAIIKGLAGPDDSIELMRLTIAEKGRGYESLQVMSILDREYGGSNSA